MAEVQHNVIYTRKSRGTDEELQLQTNLCLRYCKDKNYKVDVIFSEINSSNSYRTEYNKLIDYVKEHRNTRIICTTSDRLNRNLVAHLTLIEVAKKSDSFIETVNDGVVSVDTSEQRLMQQVIASVNEFQYQQTREKMAKGRAEAKKGGTWMGGCLYGYSTSNKRLTINPIQADVVKDIFEKASQGYSTKEISDYLTDKDIKNNNGNHFTPRAIRILVKHSGYTGQQGDKTYPPIISKELYLKANQQLRSIQQNRKKSYPLSGKIRCKNCEGIMVIGAKKSQGYALICSCKTSYSTRLNKVDCENQGCKLSTVENLVISDCKGYIENRLSELYNELKEDETIIGNHKEELQGIKDEIVKLTERLEKLKKLFLMDMIDEEELREQSKETKENIAIKELELQRMESYPLSVIISEIQDKIVLLEELKVSDSIADMVKIIDHVEYYKTNAELQVNTVFKDI